MFLVLLRGISLDFSLLICAVGLLGLAVGLKAEVVRLPGLIHDLQNHLAPTRGHALALALDRDPILAPSPGRARGAEPWELGSEKNPRLIQGSARVALVTGVLCVSGAGAGPAPLTADRGLGPGLGPSRTPQEGGAVPALAVPLLRKL